MEFLARSIDIEFLICIHTFQYPITVIFGPVTELKYIFEIIKIVFSYYMKIQNHIASIAVLDIIWSLILRKGTLCIDLSIFQ